jgi:hypothetical protein
VLARADDERLGCAHFTGAAGCFEGTAALALAVLAFAELAEAPAFELLTLLPPVPPRDADFQFAGNANTNTL